MTRRILAILVAIVLGALGTGGLLLYAATADERARSNIEAVTVAVAAERIPVGTSGARIRAEEMVRLEQVPRAAMPSDALPEVSAELDRLVLTSTTQPGQILLSAMFSESSNVTSGLNLPDGTMAVTVETGVPEQVAGYVRPGARIAIFLTFNLLDDELEETKVQRTKVLLPGVEVIGTGTYRPSQNGQNGQNGQEETTDGAAESNSGSMLVTVAVTQAEAERLIEGLHTGKLYLGLLTDSIEVVPGPGVDNVDMTGAGPLFG
jgi:pilus assembly protein CpaB